MLHTLAYGLAPAACAPAGQDSGNQGALALVIVAALLVGGICQYVARQAFNNSWQALLISAPCVVGVIYLLKDIFNI